MWTLNVTRPVDGLVTVRVNRWLREGRYPVELVCFTTPAYADDTELGLLERVARMASCVINDQRQEYLPDT